MRDKQWKSRRPRDNNYISINCWSLSAQAAKNELRHSLSLSHPLRLLFEQQKIALLYTFLIINCNLVIIVLRTRAKMFLSTYPVVVNGRLDTPEMCGSDGVIDPSTHRPFAFVSIICDCAIFPVLRSYP